MGRWQPAGLTEGSSAQHSLTLAALRHRFAAVPLALRVVCDSPRLRRRGIYVHNRTFPAIRQAVDLTGLGQVRAEPGYLIPLQLTGRDAL